MEVSFEFKSGGPIIVDATMLGGLIEIAEEVTAYNRKVVLANEGLTEATWPSLRDSEPAEDDYRTRHRIERIMSDLSEKERHSAAVSYESLKKVTVERTQDLVGVLAREHGVVEQIEIEVRRGSASFSANLGRRFGAALSIRISGPNDFMVVLRDRIEGIVARAKPQVSLIYNRNLRNLVWWIVVCILFSSAATSLLSHFPSLRQLGPGWGAAVFAVSLWIPLFIIEPIVSRLFPMVEFHYGSTRKLDTGRKVLGGLVTLILIPALINLVF